MGQRAKPEGFWAEMTVEQMGVLLKQKAWNEELDSEGKGNKSFAGILTEIDIDITKEIKKSTETKI